MKAVLEREQIESTGIGDGIAIPHARTDAVEDICICLGTSLKGIDYNAIDGSRCTLCCCWLPANQPMTLT